MDQNSRFIANNTLKTALNTPKFTLLGIMLIQGLGGPRSGHFLVFLTSKSDSLGQKTYSESRPIQSDDYFFGLKVATKTWLVSWEAWLADWEALMAG